MLVAVESLLLLYFTCLSFVSAILPIILKPLWVCLCRQSSQESSISKEMFILKFEQQKISMKDQFPAYARLQRQIINLEQRQKELVQERIGRTLKVKLGITYGIQVFLAAIVVLSSLWYKNVPLLIFQQSLFPFQDFLSYPNVIPGGISPHAWVIISRIAMRSFVKAF